MALNTMLTTFPQNAALQFQFGQNNESLKGNIYYVNCWYCQFQEEFTAVRMHQFPSLGNAIT